LRSFRSLLSDVRCFRRCESDESRSVVGPERDDLGRWLNEKIVQSSRSEEDVVAAVAKVARRGPPRESESEVGSRTRSAVSAACSVAVKGAGCPHEALSRQKRRQRQRRGVRQVGGGGEDSSVEREKGRKPKDSKFERQFALVRFRSSFGGRSDGLPATAAVCRRRKTLSWERERNGWFLCFFKYHRRVKG
jgi:hypothetical protein